jgi:hypothetical protein
MERTKDQLIGPPGVISIIRKEAEEPMTSAVPAVLLVRNIEMAGPRDPSG